MFRGSIPDDVRRMVHQIVAGWTCSDVYVGCSGNFTVERVLAEGGRFALHGNDVSLYSSALGRYFAGQMVEIDVAPAFEADYGWLRAYLKDALGAAATVMLATRLVEGLAADGTPKDNTHYRRLAEAYRERWTDLHARTVEKMAALGLRLASFCCGDVAGWVETLPVEGGFVTYPPFFGAAKAYERDFKKLDLLFTWPKPSFEPMDDERLGAFFERVMDRAHWLFVTNTRLPEYAPFLRGMAKTTNRGVPIYLYASGGPTRVVTPRQATEPVPVPRLTPGQAIGGRMTLSLLNAQQFQALRSQYMNVGIRPGSASRSVAVLVDGLLVGVYAFSNAPNAGGLHDVSRLYLLSDFPVAPTDYPRLSKLVLYAALSRESQLIAERVAQRRIRDLYTTAYSNKPASMKYRGLFKLHNRRENRVASADWGQEIDLAVNEYYRRKYELNYVAPVGRWTLDEGLALWKKKHGRRERKNADPGDTTRPA